MKLVKNVVSSFCAIKPKTDTGVGEMRLHLGSPVDQQLIDMGLSEDGNIVKFKFNSKSILKLDRLFFSLRYFNILKNDYNIRVSNSLETINEENFISIGEYYNSLLGVQNFYEVRIKNDGSRVFLVSTDFFKPICHACFPSKSEIIIEKKGANSYELKIAFHVDFLNEFGIKSDLQAMEFDDSLISNFEQSLNQSGLLFNKNIIQRFVSSLISKPFLILSGLSGSGKTKLAQSFAIWISETKAQYLLVPVGADWTNREPLLGYPNSLEKNKYVTPDSGVLGLIQNAIKNPLKPYFLILDEMNLSHVERYFADFLSAMESKEDIKLHSSIDLYSMIEDNGDFNEEYKVDESILLPSNLFIIGTVNIDETTYMFSPKVLDRANTIEFRLDKTDLSKFYDNPTPLNLNNLHIEENIDLPGIGSKFSDKFMEMATAGNQALDFTDISGILISFFERLKVAGAEFGYRTSSEIAKLVFCLKSFGSDIDEAIDFAVMQKLLPKLHGSRSKMVRILPILAQLCLINKSTEDAKSLLDNYYNGLVDIASEVVHKQIKYPVSFEKICRMYKNALDNGFTSYAEA